MILHTDKKLYIEFNDFISAGWKEDTIKKANLRNGCNWMMDKHPTDKRRPMVQYDCLVDAHKEKIQLWLRKKNNCQHNHSAKCECGNPYEYMAKEPIRKLIEKDFKAESFYTVFKLSEDRNLPLEFINKYTTAASFLNMLLRLNGDKKMIRNQLNLTLESFWQHVAEIIEADSIDLPASYKRLRLKMDEYKENGYPSLISGKFGNKQAAKIKDELSESLLLELIAHPNQYDDVLVSIQYNKWAEANEYKTITAGTVGGWRRDRGFEIIGSREGREKYNNTLRRKVSRMRPSQPTYLWESDDNHLDWYFSGDKANEFNKIKGIIVTDSFNDYVLGYAITDSEMPSELVKLAYLNAMCHVKELTGGWYLPNEVKTDQWNIKQLRPFYEGIGHYYDTPVGSKNRGWLENFFGHIDWERSMKIDNNNYTGHNITAKTTGVNLEIVQQNRKNWAHISEAEAQMANHVNRLRLMPRNYDPKNKSRQQEWLEAFQAMPEAKKKPITQEQMLLKFGFKHAWSNRITDQGICPTIMGIQYQYAVPQALYIQNAGKKVDVIYNPYDMSSVLITDNNGLRFVAESMTEVAGCMADMEENGGRALLNKILAEAKADTAMISDKSNRRKEVLNLNGFDSEDVLKLGISIPKELKQRAELGYYQPETKAVLDYEEVEEEYDINKAKFNR